MPSLCIGQSALALVVSVLLISCGQDRSSNTLPEPIRLEGVRIMEDLIGLLDIEQADSLLILSMEQEPLFRVFTKKGSNLGGFGRIGNGPGEFPDTWSNRFADVIRVQDRFHFLVFNQTKNFMRVVDVGASLSSGETVLHREYAFPRELSGAWGANVYQIRDSMLIGMYEDRMTKQLDEKRGIFYLYADEGRHEFFPLLNLSVDRFDLHASMNINARGSSITPDRSKVVMTYRFAPLIDILEVQTQTIITEQIDSIPMDMIFNLDDFKNDALVEYYGSVVATDERFYVVFTGRVPTEDQDMLIRVVDWSGNVLAQYIIGHEFELGTFIVDEPNSTIYGLSWEQDAIYEFTF
jgi:hypothetical protein